MLILSTASSTTDIVYTITVNPPSVILILNPYWAVAGVAGIALACGVVCLHVVRRCRERDTRLAVLKNRCRRRADCALEAHLSGVEVPSGRERTDGRGTTGDNKH